jgi:hypothetical protein
MKSRTRITIGAVVVLIAAIANLLMLGSMMRSGGVALDEAWTYKQFFDETMSYQWLAFFLAIFFVIVSIFLVAMSINKKEKKK